MGPLLDLKRNEGMCKTPIYNLYKIIISLRITNTPAINGSIR